LQPEVPHDPLFLQPGEVSVEVVEHELQPMFRGLYIETGQAPVTLPKNQLIPGLI
jgi:hypothetical protein